MYKPAFKISVIMAVYNTDFNLVKQAIDSVLNQTFSDFEFLIIDDGSQNNTHQLLLDYALANESKITYIRHKNAGQSASVNKGVLLSRGEYITIIDADDQYKTNHLQSCLKQIENYDLIASKTETIVDNESDYFVPNRFDNRSNIHVDDCILFATLFGKKAVFERFPFKDGYGGDADFYDRAAKVFLTKKTDLRTYIYYRNKPDSVSALLKNKNKSLLEVEKI